MTTRVNNDFETRLRRVASRQNALVKQLRKAFSGGEPAPDGCLAIEGLRVIDEAIRSGLRLQAVFFSESGRAHAARLLPQISSHTEALVLPDEVFAGAVSTDTPQGVAALVKIKTAKFQDILEQVNDDLFLVGVAGLQDPGNLGTIIRSAEAFGIQGILLGEKTVSHFNPKVARASAGALFREAVIRVDLLDSIQALKAHGVRILATSSHKGTPLPDAKLSGACMIIIGNEGAGVPPEVLSAADELITIPHSPRVESLNAGIAASIVLYEAARQRKSFTADQRG
jgi:TrmH family RNA methyltransferase